MWMRAGKIRGGLPVSLSVTHRMWDDMSPDWAVSLSKVEECTMATSILLRKRKTRRHTNQTRTHSHCWSQHEHDSATDRMMFNCGKSPQRWKPFGHSRLCRPTKTCTKGCKLTKTFPCRIMMFWYHKQKQFLASSETRRLYFFQDGKKTKNTSQNDIRKNLFCSFLEK